MLCSRVHMYFHRWLWVAQAQADTGRSRQKQGPGLSRIGHVHPPHRIAASILVGLVGMRFSLALVGLSACDVRVPVVVWCVNLWERVGEVVSG